MQLATVVAEYGSICWYCPAQATTIDHYVPKAKGGGDHLGNLRPSCETDNALKGTMLPPEWDAYRKTLDYQVKHEAGYGTYRSGIARRERKRAADKARKAAQRAMRDAARRGDLVTVEMAAEAQRTAIEAAKAIRVAWTDEQRKAVLAAANIDWDAIQAEKADRDLSWRKMKASAAA